MGDRPITWQQAVAVFAGISSFAFFVLMFAVGADAEACHRIAWIGFPISVAILVGSLRWHLWRVGRPDLVPDILAQMVPTYQILQLGRCHLYMTVRPSRGSVEIETFVQNMTDGLGTLRLQFKPSFALWGNSPVIPDLDCEVPPAAVIHVHGRFRCNFNRAKAKKLYLEGKFHSAGNQVRFARRTALTKRMNVLMCISAAVLHFHQGGAIFIQISNDGIACEDEAIDMDAQWTASLIWAPDGEFAETRDRDNQG